MKLFRGLIFALPISLVLWVLIFLAVFSCAAHATVAVSGTIKDPSGTVVPNSFVRFELTNTNNGQCSVSGASIGKRTADFTANATTGAVSGTLYRNDTEVSCAGSFNTRYNMTIFRKGVPDGPSKCVDVTADFDISAPQYCTTPPQVANPAQYVTTANNNSFTGNNAFTGTNTHSNDETFTGRFMLKDPALAVDPRAFGAKCDSTAGGAAGTDDTAAFTALSTFVLGKTPVPPIMLPGICRVSGFSGTSGLALWGNGAGQSGLRHVDGIAEPLVHVTGGSVGTSASPYYGFKGISLIGGTSTTALVYYDGNIDNNVKCEDLVLNGSNAPATMDAFSVKDYLNWHCRELRFDGIGGYAFDVRGPAVFANSSFSLREFTYDNAYAGSTTGGQRGSGLFFMDSSALLTSPKGPVSFTDARIELNNGLSGTTPTRSLFRFNVDATSNGSTTTPLVAPSFHNIQIDANNATSGGTLNNRNLKIVSVNSGEITPSFDNVCFFNVAEIYNNDAGTSKRTYPPSVSATGCIGQSGPQSYSAPQISGIAQIGGMNIQAVDTDANLGNAVVQTGDMIFYKQPFAGGGQLGRPFAYKVVSNHKGLSPVTQVTLGGTYNITSGAAVATYSTTLPTQVAPGRGILLVGAGAAAADLEGLILSVDYDAHTFTIDVNASTTVTGGIAKTNVVKVMAVPSVAYANAQPTTGTWAQGDTVLNTAVGGNGTFAWVCTTAGTPCGAWGTVLTGGSTSKISVTSQVSGTLPVVNGGTGQGALSSGTNINTLRVAGCATAASLAATCTTVVTWGTTFADTNYTANCTGELVTSGVPLNGGITAKANGSVTFTTVSGTATAAQYTKIACEARHD